MDTDNHTQYSCYSCNINISHVLYFCPYLHELIPRSSILLRPMDISSAQPSKMSNTKHHICKECLENYIKDIDYLCISYTYCPFYRNARNSRRLQ